MDERHVIPDVFRKHFVVIDDVEQKLGEWKTTGSLPRQRIPAVGDESKKDMPTSLQFYRGEQPLLLQQCPSDGSDDAALSSENMVPLHVMTFHSIMLPPNCDIDVEFDRVADEEQVKSFERNFINPAVASLHHSEREDSDNISGSLSLPPLSSSAALLNEVLFPSVLESLSLQDWWDLTRDGALLDRVHYSYTIFLHYFGWRLHDQETGEVDRHKNWRLRYDALLLSHPASASSDSISEVYALWTRMIRVLVEMKMPNYAARWLRFLCEEFQADRLLMLLPVWDDVWYPMIDGCAAVGEDVKAQLKKRRRRIGMKDDEDTDVEE